MRKSSSKTNAGDALEISATEYERMEGSASNMHQTTLTLHNEKQFDAVVLVHGLFATRRSMQPAQKHLEQRGFFVLNFGYPSYLRSVDHYSQRLIPVLRRMARDEGIRSINFLTHSFGGILVRSALQKEWNAKIRRAVMLAPPNAGSKLARYSRGAFDRLFPVVRQISDEPNSLPNRMPNPSGMDIGVIAAARDFVVSAASTTLATQQDHCVLPTTHFALPSCREALVRAVQFLQHGSFSLPQQTPVLSRAA
ncbi:MAG: esterase/lipase family protein [Pirellulaceae bacterium]